MRARIGVRPGDYGSLRLYHLRTGDNLLQNSSQCHNMSATPTPALALGWCATTGATEVSVGGCADP